MDQSATIKTWKHDQPTHDEKWKIVEAADSYGIPVTMQNTKLFKKGVNSTKSMVRVYFTDLSFRTNFPIIIPKKRALTLVSAVVRHRGHLADLLGTNDPLIIHHV